MASGTLARKELGSNPNPDYKGKTHGAAGANLRIPNIRRALEKAAFGSPVPESPASVEKELASAFTSLDPRARLSALSFLKTSIRDSNAVLNNRLIRAVAPLLGDGDESVRDAASLLLGTAAAHPKHGEPAMSILINSIGPDNRALVRQHAADGVQYAASRGAAVYNAVPGLTSCLEATDAGLQKSAALALDAAASHFARNREFDDDRKAEMQFAETKGRTAEALRDTVPALAKCLGSDDAHVCIFSSGALMRVAALGVDISRAVPMLSGSLKNRDFHVKANSAGALAFAASQGAFIRGAMVELGRCLLQEQRKSRRIREGCTLGTEKPTRMLISTLQVNSLNALGNEAINGANISSQFQYIAKLLGSEDRNVAKMAAYAMAAAVANPESKSAAMAALSSAFIGIRCFEGKYTADALHMASQMGADIGWSHPMLKERLRRPNLQKAERESVERALGVLRQKDRMAG
jgi:hypothetical protein